MFKNLATIYDSVSILRTALVQGLH